jgi:hypothetical protein
MKTNEVLRTPAEWSLMEGVTVMDPDGWRSAFAVTVDKAYAPQAWEVPVSHDEWQDRMMVSSVIRKARKKGQSLKVPADAPVLCEHDPCLTDPRCPNYLGVK